MQQAIDSYFVKSPENQRILKQKQKIKDIITKAKSMMKNKGIDYKGFKMIQKLKNPKESR